VVSVHVHGPTTAAAGLTAADQGASSSARRSFPARSSPVRIERGPAGWFPVKQGDWVYGQPGADRARRGTSSRSPRSLGSGREWVAMDGIPSSARSRHRAGRVTMPERGTNHSRTVCPRRENTLQNVALSGIKPVPRCWIDRVSSSPAESRPKGVPVAGGSPASFSRHPSARRSSSEKQGREGAVRRPPARCQAQGRHLPGCASAPGFGVTSRPAGWPRQNQTRNTQYNRSTGRPVGSRRTASPRPAQPRATRARAGPSWVESKARRRTLSAAVDRGGQPGWPPGSQQTLNPARPQPINGETQRREEGSRAKINAARSANRRIKSLRGQGENGTPR